jgi:hypothetical protein
MFHDLYKSKQKEMRAKKWQKGICSKGEKKRPLLSI